MDDVTFAARRAGSVTRGEADVESRFRALVQSPLRAGILRFLSARPGERFDIESLMQTFGRMRLDVENCVKELVDFGVVARTAGEPVTFGARLESIRLEDSGEWRIAFEPESGVYLSTEEGWEALDALGWPDRSRPLEELP